VPPPYKQVQTWKNPPQRFQIVWIDKEAYAHGTKTK
jgi:hypothetical protein